MGMNSNENGKCEMELKSYSTKLRHFNEHRWRDLAQKGTFAEQVSRTLREGPERVTIDWVS